MGFRGYFKTIKKVFFKKYFNFFFIKIGKGIIKLYKETQITQNNPA